jgi:hypothetical protein
VPPAYVKYHKNDATDAEAICEAVTGSTMRIVATKTEEQQSLLIVGAGPLGRACILWLIDSMASHEEHANKIALANDFTE